MTDLADKLRECRAELERANKLACDHSLEAAKQTEQRLKTLSLLLDWEHAYGCTHPKECPESPGEEIIEYCRALPEHLGGGHARKLLAGWRVAHNHQAALREVLEKALNERDAAHSELEVVASHRAALQAAVDALSEAGWHWDAINRRWCNPDSAALESAYAVRGDGGGMS